MAPNKYLDYSTTLGHPARTAANDSSAGVADAGKIVALNASGKVDTTMMPTGFGDEVVSLVTSENLAAGNLVNVYNNGGVPTARKADGSVTGKPCNGFVLAATTSPAAALVYFDGLNTGVTGLTAGRVFLDQATPGLATVTVPVTAGGIAQCVGTATAAGSLDFEAQEPIAI